MNFLAESVLSVLAIVVTSYLLYRWYLRRNHYWMGKPIPSDYPTPMLEVVYRAVFDKSFQDVEFHKKYGRVFGAYNGTEPCIFVGDAELLRSIFVKDFHIFHTRRELKFGIPVMDNMVSALKGGSQWRNIRNTITPAFSTGKINKMLPIMSDCANFTVNNFVKYSKENEAVDIKRLYGNYTLDVIANVAFGTKLDSHNDPDNEFVTHAKTVISQSFSIRAVIAFFFPILGKLLGLELFPSKSLQFFSNVVNTIVERRLKSKESRHDFLEIMINSLQAGEMQTNDNKDEDESGSTVQSVDEIKRKPLTKDEFLGQCLLFFLAGYETTATILTLATYYLSVNPDIKEKALKEVDEIFKKREILDTEALHEAKYIEAVIDECLRISPPPTRIERTAGEDYVLGDTGVTIPKGMIVEIPVYTIHHDKDYYPEPATFRPERFLKSEGETVVPYTYLPFGAGPRNCIAMRLALTEAKLCLLHVLKRFDFSPCEKTLIPMQFTYGVGISTPKDVILKVTARAAR